MKSIILAAGYATRLYPLTKDMPKALLPIGGGTVLDLLMENLCGVEDMSEVHIVTNHRFAGQFEQWKRLAVGAGRYGGARVTIWDDGTTSNDDRLGALGDMQFVIRHAALDDDLLVTVSDDLYPFAVRDVVEDFRGKGMDTIVATRLRDVELLRRFAVAELDDERRVLSLVEKPKDPPSDVAVFGLYVYRRETVALLKRYLDEGNAPDAPGHFPEWLCRTGRALNAFLFEGECIDIGTPESYEAAKKSFGKA